MSEDTQDKNKVVHVELGVTLEALGEALSDLTPEQVVKVLETADERQQDWKFPLTILRWADERQREWDLEMVQEDSRQTGKCVRSNLYPDENWVHTSPHKGCVLR